MEILKEILSFINRNAKNINIKETFSYIQSFNDDKISYEKNSFANGYSNRNMAVLIENRFFFTLNKCEDSIDDIETSTMTLSVSDILLPKDFILIVKDNLIFSDAGLHIISEEEQEEMLKYFDCERKIPDKKTLIENFKYGGKYIFSYINASLTTKRDLEVLSTLFGKLYDDFTREFEEIERNNSLNVEIDNVFWIEEKTKEEYFTNKILDIISTIGVLDIMEEDDAKYLIEKTILNNKRIESKNISEKKAILEENKYLTSEHEHQIDSDEFLKQLNNDQCLDMDEEYKDFNDWDDTSLDKVPSKSSLSQRDIEDIIVSSQYRKQEEIIGEIIEEEQVLTGEIIEEDFGEQTNIETEAYLIIEDEADMKKQWIQDLKDNKDFVNMKLDNENADEITSSIYPILEDTMNEIEYLSAILSTQKDSLYSLNIVKNELTASKYNLGNQFVITKEYLAMSVNENIIKEKIESINHSNLDIQEYINFLEEHLKLLKTLINWDYIIEDE